MSLLGALFTGVTGLSAQSRSMGMISDNVANVNTTAYKLARASFASMVVSEAGSLSYRPGGVVAKAFHSTASQGLLQATGSPTDVAIVGAGFFVVKGEADGGDQLLYTRAGDFGFDASGNIRTPSGFYLQGWRLDQNGAIRNVNQLETVNVNVVNSGALPTTRITLAANLDADQPPHTGGYAPGDMAAHLAGTGDLAPHFTREVRIFDSLGRPRDITFAFLKSEEPNVWNLEIVADPTDVDVGEHPNGLLASAVITFDGDGTLADVELTPLLEGEQGIMVRWAEASGAEASDIAIDLGEPGTASGLAQFATPSSVAFVSQNGAAVGNLSSVGIDEQGYVVASFSNGQERRLYRLALATFPNPAGLDPRSGNVYARSELSGEAVLRAPGEGGAGRLAPSALEASNVDLADEFTKMIITQRAYSANARVISTTDEMLDELIRLRR